MKRNIKILYIKVSENCNSHCFMCHYAGKKDSYNITLDQYKDVLSYAHKNKIKMIRFTGGEPLIHNNIIEFIKLANDNGFLTSIITNGFLLKRKAKELANNGLYECIISLDGSNEEVHDELRNFKGCFLNILKGIEELRKNNPNILLRVNTVVSGRNIHDLVNIYKLLLDLNINQWSIIPVKSKENTWTVDSEKYYKEFLKAIKRNDDNKLEFLGYSKIFAGTTKKEISDTFTNNRRIISTNPCSVVDYVRFYIPEKDLIVPCNCIAHRLDKFPLELDKGREENCEKLRKWIKKHNSECTGCEPLNVYINDYPNIMEEEQIKY